LELLGFNYWGKLGCHHRNVVQRCGLLYVLLPIFGNEYVHSSFVSDSSSLKCLVSQESKGANSRYLNLDDIVSTVWWYWWKCIHIHTYSSQLTTVDRHITTEEVRRNVYAMYWEISQSLVTTRKWLRFQRQIWWCRGNCNLLLSCSCILSLWRKVYSFRRQKE
jgi:hypothetical protein